MKNKQNLEDFKQPSKNEFQRLMDHFASGNYLDLDKFYEYLQKKYHCSDKDMDQNIIYNLLQYESSQIPLSIKHMDSLKLAYLFFHSDDCKNLIGRYQNSPLEILKERIVTLFFVTQISFILQKNNAVFQETMATIANNQSDKIQQHPEKHWKILSNAIDADPALSQLITAAAMKTKKIVDDLNRAFANQRMSCKKLLQEIDKNYTVFEKTMHSYIAPYQKCAQLQGCIQSYIDHLNRKINAKPRKVKTSDMRDKRQNALEKMKTLLADAATIAEIEEKLPEFYEALNVLQQNQTIATDHGSVIKRIALSLSHLNSKEKKFLQTIEEIMNPILAADFAKKLYDYK